MGRWIAPGPIMEMGESHVRHEIAARVDQGETVPALQVLERHVLQESRFYRARLTDDVDMQKAIFVFDPEDALVAPKIDKGETRDIIRRHTGPHRPAHRSFRGEGEFCR